ncbi:MAG TPA: hypothetical protein PKD00_03310 [Burkholderiales bacterium]|nr:hypothetical protein [Burkholderiales bacterium]
MITNNTIDITFTLIETRRDISTNTITYIPHEFTFEIIIDNNNNYDKHSCFFLELPLAALEITYGKEVAHVALLLFEAIPDIINTLKQGILMESFIGNYQNFYSQMISHFFNHDEYNRLEKLRMVDKILLLRHCIITKNYNYKGESYIIQDEGYNNAVANYLQSIDDIFKYSSHINMLFKVLSSSINCKINDFMHKALNVLYFTKENRYQTRTYHELFENILERLLICQSDKDIENNLNFICQLFISSGSHYIDTHNMHVDIIKSCISKKLYKNFIKKLNYE